MLKMKSLCSLRNFYWANYGPGLDSSLKYVVMTLPNPSVIVRHEVQLRARSHMSKSGADGRYHQKDPHTVLPILTSLPATSEDAVVKAFQPSITKY